MIELIQFPWSPFCIVQRRILEFSGARFKITNIPNGDRSLVWRLTRQRYYGVPIIRQGKSVIFEVSEDSQVIAKYLDAKLQLGLFPWDLEGVQSIIWRYIENEVEGVGFKLNDIYWREVVPAADQLAFLRHKERKFGRAASTSGGRTLAECARQTVAQAGQLVEGRPALVEGVARALPAGPRLAAHEHPRLTSSSIALLKVTGFDASGRPTSPSSCARSNCSRAARASPSR